MACIMSVKAEKEEEAYLDLLSKYTYETKTHTKRNGRRDYSCDPAAAVSAPKTPYSTAVRTRKCPVIGRTKPLSNHKPSSLKGGAVEAAILYEKASAAVKADTAVEAAAEAATDDWAQKCAEYGFEEDAAADDW